jgi:hypothetical protein
MNVKRAFALLLAAGLAAPLPCRAAEQEWDVEVAMWRRSGPSAALRSLLVPGWGQFYNRQRPKGGTLFFVAAGSLGGALYMDKRARDSYGEYLAAGLPSDAAYSRYRRERNVANLCAATAAVAWIGAVWDAYVQGEKLKVLFNEQHARTRRFEVALLPGAASAAWRFGGSDEE